MQKPLLTHLNQLRCQKGSKLLDVAMSAHFALILVFFAICLVQIALSLGVHHTTCCATHPLSCLLCTSFAECRSQHDRVLSVEEVCGTWSLDWSNDGDKEFILWHLKCQFWWGLDVGLWCALTTSWLPKAVSTHGTRTVIPNGRPFLTRSPKIRISSFPNHPRRTKLPLNLRNAPSAHGAVPLWVKERVGTGNHKVLKPHKDNITKVHAQS